jgi:hypothetical protein
MSAQVKYATRSKPEAISRRAQRMLDDNKGDKARTIRQLVNLAENQPTLREALIKLGATALVGGLICKERAAIVRGVEAEQIKFTGSGTVVVPPVMSRRQADMRRNFARRTVVRAWLEFRLPIPGNKKLGNANGADLNAGAEAYRRQSGDMAHKAAWLEAIRPKIPKGKTVSDVLDDKALDALYEDSCA